MSPRQSFRRARDLQGSLGAWGVRIILGLGTFLLETGAKKNKRAKRNERRHEYLEVEGTATSPEFEGDGTAAGLIGGGMTERQKGWRSDSLTLELSPGTYPGSPRIPRVSWKSCYTQVKELETRY